MNIKYETKIFGSLIALFIISILSILFTFSSEEPSTRSKHFRKILSTKMSSSEAKEIALINLYGPITTSSPPSFYKSVQGSDELIKTLEVVLKEKKVKALILRINSPGGTVGSAQEIYNYLKTFKAKKDIPIIASIADIGTSGAYWVALGSDVIFANPGSMIGSIGVFMGNYDLSGLSEKFGIGYTIVKGGKYKDTLSQWKKPSEDEINLLSTLINNVHNQFLKVVSTERNISMKKMQQVGDGRIFTGEQALNEKLVDKLGGLNEAIEYAKKEAGIEGTPVIYTPKNEDFLPFLPWVTSFKKKIENLSLLRLLL